MADCKLCVAVVGNHTVPIRERRRIMVKLTEPLYENENQTQL